MVAEIRCRLVLGRGACSKYDPKARLERHILGALQTQKKLSDVNLTDNCDEYGSWIKRK